MATNKGVINALMRIMEKLDVITNWGSNGKGVYAAGTQYQKGDLVSYNGLAYVAIIATLGNLPTNTTYWQQITVAGPAGTMGPPGPPGANGAAGSNGTNGTNAINMLNGSGAPGAGLGVDGDYYLNDANGDVYWKQSGTWSVVANFMGPGGGGGAENILKNGKFINNSSNGYGATPDDWVNSAGNPVQGGLPALTKQNLIDLLGINDGDIEGLWNLNGNLNDLSSNGYNLTPSASAPTDSSDGLMAQCKSFASASNQYATNAAANCRVAGNQTFFAIINPASLTTSSEGDICGVGDSTPTNYALIGLALNKFKLAVTGLTPSSVSSDVIQQTNMWYFVVGVYDSSNAKLKIWVNGIKKEVSVSGSHTAGTGGFSIGRVGDYNSQYFNGKAQHVGMLSIALSDTQVKRLFAATLYKGLKIRRSGADGYIEQSLPEDLVVSLRGKQLTLIADLAQDTANIAQLEINDGSSATSSTFASTSATPTETSVSKTISTTATSIKIRIKAITSNGNVWADNVRLGVSASAFPYAHSKDDWARFPKLLQLKFPHIYSGYQYEQFRMFTSPFTNAMRASGSMTTTSVSQALSQFIFLGETIQPFITMTWTNGGTAHVANYCTLPFSVLAAMVSASNGHAVQVVNNAVQEVGVCRYASKNEVEIYRYTGGNWSLAANQTYHENSIFPIELT